MNDQLITSPAEILFADKLSPAQSRYWNSCAKREALRAQVVDPFRHSLKELRSILPAGTTVYRASTGGKWGKSAQVVSI